VTRTSIIVSPYFPPSTLAGVHRARHLAKHLPAAGWNPIVVCVDEAYHEERLDPGLAALVPATVEVVKVRALPPRVCRPLGLGEISLRAWRPLRRAVLRLIETRPVGAVLITGSPYYPMLLAGEIRRRFRVPVVLDFQDPWVSAWGATLPRLSKGGVVDRLSTWLEPKALRAADFITSVSATQNEQMAARYPWLDASRMAALPIGGDPEDYEALRRTEAVRPQGLLEPGTVAFTYAGTFMPRTEPVMRTFLAAYAQARHAQPGLLSNVRLCFVGTSNQPNEQSQFRALPIAEEFGLGDVVREIPQRLPYLEAIGILAGSQGILLIGSDELHYTASKIYPGLMSGRPYLSLFHARSSSHEILTRAGGGIAIGFESAGHRETLVSALAEAIVRLATSPDSMGRADPAAYADYTAERIAHRYGGIFDGLTCPAQARRLAYPKVAN
jgi:hypothetical protein